MPAKNNSNINEGSSLLNRNKKENDFANSRSPAIPSETEINIDPGAEYNEYIDESEDLKSTCEEIFKELKAHFWNDIPLPLLAAAAIFGVIGLTSWGCNNTAVPQLVDHFKKTFNIEIDSAIITEFLQISASIGGAGGNLILNYFGTRSLHARWKTIKESFTGGSYGYLASYILIALSAGIAATSSGFVVAESATSLSKQLFDFALNFGASVGPHMLFAIPFVGLLDRSPTGDMVKSSLTIIRDTLKRLKENTLNCLLTKKEYDIVLETRQTEVPIGSDPRINIPSAVFNISRRLVIEAGYALASLNNDSEANISKIKQQIIIITNILADLGPDKVIWVKPENNDIQAEAENVENDDILIEPENNNIQIKSDSDKEPIINPFKDYPKKNINALTPNGEIKYLLELSEFISNLTLDQQTLFFLRVAKKLNIQPESTLEGSILTLANAVSLPFSFFSCLANLNSIKQAFSNMASLFTSNSKTINEIGYSFAGAGAPSKDAMYWNSLLAPIERIFFLPQTLKWLWQSSKVVKAIIPTTGVLSFYLGLCSGACYALDFLNSFDQILDGYLLKFFELFGSQGIPIGIAISVSIGWIGGAGMVNGNALSTVVPDIVLSIIHIFQPEQKANDALSRQAIAIAAKMIGNMVPDSKVGKAVEKVMLTEYQETMQKSKLDKITMNTTYNTRSSNKESCCEWAIRRATFGFYDSRKLKLINEYEEINGDCASMQNMAANRSRRVNHA